MRLCPRRLQLTKKVNLLLDCHPIGMLSGPHSCHTQFDLVLDFEVAIDDVAEKPGDLNVQL